MTNSKRETTSEARMETTVETAMDAAVRRGVGA